MLPQGVEDDVDQLREGEQILIAAAAVLGEECVQEGGLQDVLGQGEDRPGQGEAVDELVEKQGAGLRRGGGGAERGTTRRMIGRQNHGKRFSDRLQEWKDLESIAAARQGLVQLPPPCQRSETMKCHTLS